MPTPQEQDLVNLLATQAQEIEDLLGFYHCGERFTYEDLFLALHRIRDRDAIPSLHTCLLCKNGAPPISFTRFQSIIGRALLIAAQTRPRGSPVASSGKSKVSASLTRDRRAIETIENACVGINEAWMYEPLARWLEFVHAKGTHIAHVPCHAKGGAGTNADVLGVPVAAGKFLHEAFSPCDVIAIDAKNQLKSGWPADLAQAATYYRFANRVYVAYPLSCKPVATIKHFDSALLRHAAKLGVGVLAVLEPKKYSSLRRRVRKCVDQLSTSDAFAEHAPKINELFDRAMALGPTPGTVDTATLAMEEAIADADSLLANLRERVDCMPKPDAVPLHDKSGCDPIHEPLNLLRNYRNALEEMKLLTAGPGRLSQAWERAHVQVVLESQPNATSIQAADAAVKEAWRWIHMRRHILAHVLRSLIGPHVVNAQNACKQLTDYNTGDGNSIVRLWRNEMERVLNKSAGCIADAWGNAIDKDFMVKDPKTRKTFLEFLFKA